MVRYFRDPIRGVGDVGVFTAASSIADRSGETRWSVASFSDIHRDIALIHPVDPVHDVNPL